MNLRELFAGNLRRLRHARQLSQESIAADAGISREYVSKLESGQHSVSIDVVEQLARVLEVEPYTLLMPPAKGERTARK